MSTTWPYPENQAIERLRQAIAAHPHDENQSRQYRALLEEFWKRFPRERLRDLRLEDYALGQDNDQVFCNWLEQRLAPLGRYSLRNSLGHYIFRDKKNGNWILLKKLRHLTPEQAMQRVATWHDKIVQVGGSDHPEELDKNPPDFKEARSRVLKLLSVYYPDRYEPITSMEHLAHFLRLFGVPKEEIPAGAVARNLLLHQLYERLAQPAGLTPFEFMDILYTNAFSPAMTLIRHQIRLKAAKRIFGWLYGHQAFANPRYLSDERNYKVKLSEEWRQKVTPEVIDGALAEGKEEALARSITELLTDQQRGNLFPWRYHAVFRKLRAPDQVGTFLEATRDLLSIEEEGTPDVERFNRAMEPLYKEHLDAGSVVAVSRSLPTLMLWLSYPDSEFYLRSELFNRLRKALTGAKPQEGEGLLSNVEYGQVRELVGALREALTEFSPRDMIDVQGFCWVVFGQSKIWFGGTKYEERDVFPEFLSKKVFGTGYAKRDDVAAIMKDAARYQGEERATRRKELEQLLATKGERDAVLRLFDLAGASGSLIIAKTTYGHTPIKLRVRGIGRTKSESFSDGDLGHQIGVDWLAQPDSRISAGGSFGYVASTLSEVPLDKALDLLAGSEGGAEDDQEENKTSIKPPVEIQRPVNVAPLAARPPLPLNLILYGPPGTGKTWRVLETYRKFFEETGQQRWRMITFHPAYSYEEFIEGLRPVTQGKDVRYEVVPGILRLIVAEAEQDPERYYALFIDEINRGNVAALFGELITLIEEDKRCRPEDPQGTRLQLPYSKQLFGVPPNLYIIGTMNTADRSIALLDVALRRRFHFKEIRADVDVLREELNSKGVADGLIEGIDVARMLEVMNERLRYLYDRDHQIGHAWLMGVRSLGDLRQTFHTKILPLLSEYFYEDWAKVCLVLGEDPRKIRSTDLLNKRSYNAEQQRSLFGRGFDAAGDKVLYDVSDPQEWAAGHFSKIYQSRSGDE